MGSENFMVPSPDDWHAPILECLLCSEVLEIADRSTLLEVNALAFEHEKICIPRPWTFRRKYIGDDHSYYSWYEEHQPLTDEEKAAKIEEYADTQYKLEFIRRY